METKKNWKQKLDAFNAKINELDKKLESSPLYHWTCAWLYIAFGIFIWVMLLTYDTTLLNFINSPPDDVTSLNIATFLGVFFLYLFPICNAIEHFNIRKYLRWKQKEEANNSIELTTE